MNRCIACDCSDLVGILFFSFFFFVQAFFSFHFLRPAFYTVLALSMLDAEIQELRYQVGKFFQIVHATVGKPGLKLNIQKMKIMASGPITSWQIDGETMGTVRDYFFKLQNHCRW